MKYKDSVTAALFIERGLEGFGFDFFFPAVYELLL